MTEIIKLSDAEMALCCGPLEVLTCSLGAEEYGIDIERVQELRGYDSVMRIANTPNYIKGVVNLRGVIVPIIDMRIKLRLGSANYDMYTAVIILNIGSRVIGIVVDSVSDVVSLAKEQIKPASQMGTTIGTECLLGIGTFDERTLILVDIEKLISSKDLGVIEKIAV